MKLIFSTFKKKIEKKLQKNKIGKKIESEKKKKNENENIEKRSVKRV